MSHASDLFNLGCSLQNLCYSTFSRTEILTILILLFSIPSQSLKINRPNESTVYISSYLILKTVIYNVVATAKPDYRYKNDFESAT
jgi:hypothetical protein